MPVPRASLLPCPASSTHRHAPSMISIPPMNFNTTRNVGASLLLLAAIFGCVALLVIDDVVEPSRPRSRRRSPGPAPDPEATGGLRPPSRPSHRRRLSLSYGYVPSAAAVLDDEERERQTAYNVPSAVAVLDDEERERQAAAYLGGLVPATDREGLPLFLRDASEPAPNLRTIYDWRERDLVFFWHIPRVRF